MLDKSETEEWKHWREHGRGMSYTAARTQQQLLQERDRLTKEFGPQTGAAPIVHTFPDGWTIRRLDTHAHETYEGELMGNCVGGAGSLRNMDPNDWHTPSGDYDFKYHSIRDPHNLPHGTFVVNHKDPDPAMRTKSFWDLDLEGRHGSNAGKYAPYVHDWWTKHQGGTPANPKTYEYEYGMPLVEAGSFDHQRESEDNFAPYKSHAFWDASHENRLQHPEMDYLRRAVKPLRKAQKALQEGTPWDVVEAQVRKRLGNNYKDYHVNYMVNDLKKEHEKWEKFQPYDDQDWQPPARIELPEFYYMHHAYGPDVMEEVLKAQRMYRALHWNHPNMAASALRHGLDERGLDKEMVDTVVDQFLHAHGQAWGARQGFKWDHERETNQFEPRKGDRLWTEAEMMANQFFPDLSLADHEKKRQEIYDVLMSTRK